MDQKEESSMSESPEHQRGLSSIQSVEDEANLSQVDYPGIFAAAQPQMSGWYTVNADEVAPTNLVRMGEDYEADFDHNHTISFNTPPNPSIFQVEDDKGNSVTLRSNGRVEVRGDADIDYLAGMFWSKVVSKSPNAMAERIRLMCRDIIEIIETCEDCDGKELCNRCQILTRSLDPQQVTVSKDKHGVVAFKLADSDEITFVNGNESSHTMHTYSMTYTVPAELVADNFTGTWIKEEQNG